MPAYIHNGRRVWLDLPIRWKGVAAVAVPVVCLLLELFALSRLSRAEESVARWTLHSQQVKSAAEALLGALVDSETGERGYALTLDPKFLEPYHNALITIPSQEQKLEALVSDNREQSEQLKKIEALAQEKIGIVDGVIHLVDAQRANGLPGHAAPFAASVSRGKQVMDTERAEITTFLADENTLLAARSERLGQIWRRTVVALWLGALVGLIGGFVAAWILGWGITTRLATVGRDADALAQGDALGQADDSNDEIGVLARRLRTASLMLAEKSHEAEQARELLQTRNVSLEAANAELEAFSYSVSHDLRAPLRHMDGFSRILLDDYGPQLPGEAQRLLSRIREGAARMGQLIDELLQLGRVSRQEMRVQITGLGNIVETVRANLEREAGQREIEWRIAPLPFAECDAGLMTQVFQNLLSNAVKYTRPRERAVIEVGTVESKEGLALRVGDNGVGFNQKYSDKLFRVFQRLHRQEDFEGTGVGLATAARIVQRHGGRIWAEAELDRGATFYFTLAGMQGASSAPEQTAKQEAK